MINLKEWRDLCIAVMIHFVQNRKEINESEERKEKSERENFLVGLIQECHMNMYKSCFVFFPQVL